MQADKNNSQASELQEQPSNSLPEIGNTRVISYNLSERERPGGIKVRYKLKVVSGPRARDIDAAQAQAIKEALQWSLTHRRR